jgi:hypothetical protein
LAAPWAPLKKKREHKKTTSTACSGTDEQTKVITPEVYAKLRQIYRQQLKTQLMQQQKGINEDDADAIVDELFNNDNCFGIDDGKLAHDLAITS